MPTKPLAGRRVSPADLPPDLRAKFEATKAKANVDLALGLCGPPADVDMTDAAPFYFVLQAFLKQLRDAREAAGLTLAEVAVRTGMATETLSRLETGTATNPTWQTLGRYAAAVGCKIQLSAEPE